MQNSIPVKSAQSDWNFNRIGGGGGGVTLFLKVRLSDGYSTLQIITPWPSLPDIFNKKDASKKKKMIL